MKINDIEAYIKRSPQNLSQIKKIMDSLNTSNKDDPRANLLLSLKPYLNETKKDKIDNYVKFLQFAKIIEVMNPLGGDEVKDE